MVIALRRRLLRAIGLSLSGAVACLMMTMPPGRADDWPQWRGSERDGQWRETGIRAALPADGLPARWRAEVGGGYSGPAVSDGRVYLMDYVGQDGAISNNPSQRTEIAGRERVLCFDATDGRLLWKHEYDCPYAVSYACGPRCTPTVVDGVVYALGAEGNLHALDALTGKVLWEKNFKTDYGAPTPIWGFSSHPLVEGDLVICMVGGEGSVVVAFDRRTGKEVWRALSASEPGYAPPSILETAGVPLIPPPGRRSGACRSSRAMECRSWRRRWPTHRRAGSSLPVGSVTSAPSFGSTTNSPARKSCGVTGPRPRSRVPTARR